MPVNFRSVVPGLYRSGRITPTEIRMLTGAPYNINKIISLDRAAGTIIAPYIKQYGIEQVFIPMLDGSNVRSIAEFIRNNAQSLFKTDGGKSVLVHCEHGRDRTGFVVALYNVIIQGRSCINAIEDAKKLGYGTGISKDAENQLNAEICKACKMAHTHYCIEATKPPLPGEEGAPKTAAKKDIRDLLENEEMLIGNPANSIGPAAPTQQSFAPYIDPTGEGALGANSVDVANNDDCKNRKERMKILRKLLKSFIDKDNNELDMPSVGMRSNFNGISDSSLNPPSGADGGTPGSNISAQPVGGAIPQM
jgi:hypothetical protein